MFSRSLAGLRCYGCDVELSTNDIINYQEFDGMCEDCFSIAMDAAYDDLDEYADFNDE